MTAALSAPPARHSREPGGISSLALLGCSDNYGRDIAACLLPHLGDGLILTNRNRSIVRSLERDFPRVDGDNASAVRQAEWVGILVRPPQVKDLLAEICTHLRPGQLVLNFTASRWHLPARANGPWKLDIAVAPPVGHSVQVAFYRPDPSVPEHLQTALLNLLSRMARRVIETQDSVAEMTLMARCIAHFAAYSAALTQEGFSQPSVTAHLLQLAACLEDISADELLARASTKGGITSTVAELFTRDPAFGVWVARERNAVAPWLAQAGAALEAN